MIFKMGMKNLFSIFCFFLLGFPVVPAQECGNVSFIPHSNYDTNRGLLLSSFASNVSSQGAFYNASFGQGPDRVYALGMCVQGAKREACSNCVDLASKALIEKCPNQTEGLAWPENGILCMVRYSNRPFFGSPEMQPSYKLFNTGDIGTRSNLTKFDRLWEDFNISLSLAPPTPPPTSLPPSLGGQTSSSNTRIVVIVVISIVIVVLILLFLANFIVRMRRSVNGFS